MPQDFAQLREALGIEDGVPDAEVTAYARDLHDFLGSADIHEAAPTAPTSAPTAPPALTPVPAPVVQEAAPVAASAPSGFITAADLQAAMRPLHDTIRDLSGQLASRNQADAATAKSALLASALDSGKITPAEQPAWEARYDKAPDVTADILASIAPGAAMTTRSAGHNGTQDTAGGMAADLNSEYERMFPGAPKAGA